MADPLATMGIMAAPHLFVGIMKMTVGVSAACGVTTAAREIPQEWCGAWIPDAAPCSCGERPLRPRPKRGRAPPQPPDGGGDGGGGAEEPGAAAAGGGGTEGGAGAAWADDVGEEEDADAVVLREQQKADAIMSRVINAMVLGGGAALVGSIPVSVLLWNEANWVMAAQQAGCAAVFFSPVIVLWCRASYFSPDGQRTSGITAHLPSYILILTAINMGVSITTLGYQLIQIGKFPLGGLVSKAALVRMDEATALYYLTGCRIALMGTSAMLLSIFANRFAQISRSKRLNEGTPQIVTLGNSVLINGCQVAGNVVAAMSFWAAFTDHAGSISVSPAWLEMMRLAYMFGVQAALSSPSEDHDEAPVGNMLRSALIGFHAVVLVPTCTSEVGIMVQQSLEHSSYAAWFGTFDREWRPAEVRRNRRLLGPQKVPELPPMRCHCCCCGFEIGGSAAAAGDGAGSPDTDAEAQV